MEARFWVVAVHAEWSILLLPVQDGGRSRRQPIVAKGKKNKKEKKYKKKKKKEEEWEEKKNEGKKGAKKKRRKKRKKGRYIKDLKKTKGEKELFKFLYNILV